MPKGYFLSAHRKEADPVKAAAYAKLAIPAIEGAGGRILAKGGKVQARENGIADSVLARQGALISVSRIIMYWCLTCSSK